MSKIWLGFVVILAGLIVTPTTGLAAGGHTTTITSPTHNTTVDGITLVVEGTVTLSGIGGKTPSRVAIQVFNNNDVVEVQISNATLTKKPNQNIWDFTTSGLTPGLSTNYTGPARIKATSYYINILGVEVEGAEDEINVTLN